jgi:hypothetical protein
VVTMPDGMVKGPDRVFPKNSVFKVAGSRMQWMNGSRDAQVYWFAGV